MPPSDLNSAAALRTARDSAGCCHAHSNCTSGRNETGALQLDQQEQSNRTHDRGGAKEGSIELSNPNRCKGLRGKNRGRAYLERGDVGGEAVDAEHHLPRPAPAGPPRAAGDLSVVLPDPPARVHRETDVGAALAAWAQGPEQVAAEKPAAAACGGPLPLWPRRPAAFRAAIPGIAVR